MKIIISLAGEAPLLDEEDWDTDHADKEGQPDAVGPSAIKAQIRQEKAYQLERVGNEGEHHRIWK